MKHDNQSVVNEYFSRSPYASIEKLANGSFQVVNLVNGCEFHPASTWNQAICIRQEIVQHYKNVAGGR